MNGMAEVFLVWITVFSVASGDAIRMTASVQPVRPM
jgi:hypothetical protein